LSRKTELSQVNGSAFSGNALEKFFGGNVGTNSPTQTPIRYDWRFLALKTKLVHVRLDPKRIAAFSRVAKRRGVSFDELVSQGVELLLKQLRA